MPRLVNQDRNGGSVRFFIVYQLYQTEKAECKFLPVSPNQDSVVGYLAMTWALQQDSPGWSRVRPGAGGNGHGGLSSGAP